MEQRLDATYLRQGVFERAAAIAVVAAGVGAGILLASWGISFFWRHTLPEIVVEVRVVQDGPLAVPQDKPQLPTLRVPVPPGPDAQTPSGDVIRREVTVFSNVRHGSGTVFTGWNYKDGGGGVPVKQFCYYTVRNEDQSSRRIDLALDGRPEIGVDLVPDIEGALSKCQWWQP